MGCTINMKEYTIMMHFVNQIPWSEKTTKKLLVVVNSQVTYSLFTQLRSNYNCIIQFDKLTNSLVILLICFKKKIYYEHDIIFINYKLLIY